MVWNRWLPSVLACTACAGTPIESATTDTDGDTTSADATDASASDPSTDPTTDPTTDPSADTSTTRDPDDSGSATTVAGDSTTSTTEEMTAGETEGRECHPQINEVAFDVVGDDDLLEWIVVFNPCAEAIDLGGYSLGWGGMEYDYGTQDLAGVLAPAGCHVVGGTLTVASNYGPVFSQAVDLELDLQNADDSDADGVALFVGLAAAITPTSVPVDAVIYGTDNIHALIDETGERSPIDVIPGTDMQTIARLPNDGDWIVNASPSPNDCSAPAA